MGARDVNKSTTFINRSMNCYIIPPSKEEILEHERQVDEYWNKFWENWRAELRQELEPIKNIKWN